MASARKRQIRSKLRGIKPKQRIKEISFGINEKGEVFSKTVFSKFLNNFKFTFKVLSKSFGSSFQLKIDGKGWAKLKEALKVRDRLMHPKQISDLEVSENEVQSAKKAFDWFVVIHGLCTNYAQQALFAKSNLEPENIVATNSIIEFLEKKLALED